MIFDFAYSAATVWDAIWAPWGNVWAITGTASLDARLPGQWYQLESGLHYNWYRHYDPTLGRYTQPDPLGFVVGPSVYGYVKGRPAILSDAEGLGSTNCPTGQRPASHPDYPDRADIIICVPNPSDPTPGCADGSCVVDPPETNSACVIKCIKTWKKTTWACQATSAVGLKGTKTLCDVVVQSICGQMCSKDKPKVPTPSLTPKSISLLPPPQSPKQCPIE